MDQIYLIFGHQGARFGIDVHLVHEIVRLPELSPIEELPPHIAGVFNLRGQVVPVMDLGLRFGHGHRPWITSDLVIVIDSGSSGARVGLVVNELHDVVALPAAAIERANGYQGAGGSERFVFGEGRLDDGLIMLLDVEALLRDRQYGEICAQTPTPIQADTPQPWFAELPAEEAELFGARARSLAQVPPATERAGLQAMAVIRLGDELFGPGVDVVRGFPHLRGITPVPCCPPHILGNMNLRGDIITLVDIRPALGMDTAGAMNEVVVVRSGELLFGLPAAEIVDVAQIAPSDIQSVPVASDRAGKAYCLGVAALGGRAVGILDLNRILAARELQVAEQAQ